MVARCWWLDQRLIPALETRSPVRPTSIQYLVISNEYRTANIEHTIEHPVFENPVSSHQPPLPRQARPLPLETVEASPSPVRLHNLLWEPHKWQTISTATASIIRPRVLEARSKGKFETPLAA